MVALDAAAAAAGLRIGMPAAQAQATVPGLALRPAEPQADAEALERLAVRALRYSPLVAVDASGGLPADGLVLETTGAAHLHGGEEAMLADMVARLARIGITARAAAADHLGAAHAFARRCARPTLVVAPGESRALLEALPLAALRLPAGMPAALHRLGFETIGDLARRPRAPLILRFGPELGRRLDQAFGHVPEPFEPVRPVDLVEVKQGFMEPIGAPETLARYTEKLTLALCAALEAKGLGARRLDLLFHRVDDRIEAVRIGTATPQRDPARLTRLLCAKLETVAPGFGIEEMRLAATLAEPLANRQSVSSLAEEPEADVADLVDTLSNRIGERNIYRLEAVESDVPERAQRRVAALAEEGRRSVPPARWPRPARLLPVPDPIDTIALLPDHPPVGFTWKGVRHRVKRADGPERVFGEWWKRDAETAAVRDYFRVENEAGERFWIYRAGDGADPATGSHRWFLHGFFA